MKRLTLEEQNIGVHDPTNLTNELIGRDETVRFWIPEVITFKEKVLSSTKIPSCKVMESYYLSAMKSAKNFKNLSELIIYGPIGRLRKRGCYLFYGIKYTISGITKYDYISVYEY